MFFYNFFYMLKLAFLDTPVIPVLGRLRQKDCKFKASQDYIA
jgi:hypothetical protein